MKPRVLFICGSVNQTTQMHRIAECLADDIEPAFTPYYCDGLLEFCRRRHLLETTVLGSKLAGRALAYLRTNNLPVDDKGKHGPYDLVVTCSDLIVPQNIRRTKTVLVQEGMTDPENFMYHLVRRIPLLPRWLASTSTTGLSGMYDRFCVASAGYRRLFMEKGIPPHKITVTGIPNFDNCARFLENDFPLKGYVLVCTSDTRETYKFENRRRFIRKSLDMAAGRDLIFKLHPNEFAERAIREIRQLAPRALVFTSGNTEAMIANCSVLITRYSSTIFVGLALGKECHSDFHLGELRELMPEQNSSAAENIGRVCLEVLGDGRLRPLCRPVREAGRHSNKTAPAPLAWASCGRDTR